MWPSWLWVTPLGEVPAVLCPACLVFEAGQMCCCVQRISVPQQCKVSKMQAHGRHFCSGPHLMLFHWPLNDTGGRCLVCCIADGQPHIC